MIKFLSAPKSAPAMPAAIDVGSRGSWRSAAVWLGVGALLAAGWHAYGSARKRALDERSQPLPPRLQTWEGEGGTALPESD